VSVTSPSGSGGAATSRFAPDLVLYRVVRGILYGFSRLFWRLTIEGTEHLPSTGPYVVAPVHRSNIDTVVVAMIARRRLRFMGKDSLWSRGWSAWLFSALGGFPVHRGTVDREALRRCINVIEGGEPLVVFPEGTRRGGPLVEELFDGAAYIATRTGVPIVPVGVAGSEAAMPRGAKMLRPVKIHVVIGAPLYPEAVTEGGRAPRRAVHDLTVALHKEIQRLFDQAQAKIG
jgi:1-acyl-sn-glycerol-3-phosphate acyltransferase